MSSNRSPEMWSMAHGYQFQACGHQFCLFDWVQFECDLLSTSNGHSSSVVPEIFAHMHNVLYPGEDITQVADRAKLGSAKLQTLADKWVKHVITGVVRRRKVKVLKQMLAEREQREKENMQKLKENMEELEAEKKAAQEIEAEKKKVAQEIEAEKKKAAQEIEAEKKKAAQEIEAEKKKAAQEIEAEKKKAAQEIEAEKKKAAQEIEALKRQLQKQQQQGQ
ncbi:hypothetical protein VOLCADRAFT_105647 [Volvox carteri f. nagariensis]|uniref:Uncharacterized protein n=1 Tax=Volvox carteri f. nagariensis TaxID=3068 RepID=D8U234_VOLCA|nr:uncharacterized protein VOLCADRAFT_105647 [Volvox carteri f. nagariensis]EFJ46293.1 hypothetical protein VOLCADRAFT_105647 [Volvox carteri f. nagariensis]|eukprot:XP_002952740.1 hypothetical protein VOLCADRAFT_105647 [Volvox carteri f. nagariensis]